MIKPRSQTIESIGYPPTGHVIEILSPATEVMFGIRLIVGRPYTLIRAVCCMVATSFIAWQVYRPPSDRKEKKDDDLCVDFFLMNQEPVPVSRELAEHVFFVFESRFHPI